MDAISNESAPYKTVEEALRRAYGDDVSVSGNIFASMMGGSIRDRSDLKASDWVGQNRMCRQFIWQQLHYNQPWLMALEAWYASVEQPAVQWKAHCCAQLGVHLTEALELTQHGKRKVIDAWLTDHARRWVGLSRLGSERDFALQIGVDESTLFRWRQDQRTRVGVRALLRNWRMGARDSMRERMFDIGLIQYG